MIIYIEKLLRSAKSAITIKLAYKINSYSNIFKSRIHWIFYLDDHVV